MCRYKLQDSSIFYYWGKVTKLFSNDEDTEVTQVEVDFLQKKAISSNPAAWTWAEKTVEEVLIIDSKFILFGPVLPEIRKNILTFLMLRSQPLFKNLRRGLRTKI